MANADPNGMPAGEELAVTPLLTTNPHLIRLMARDRIYIVSSSLQEIMQRLPSTGVRKAAEEEKTTRRLVGQINECMDLLGQVGWT